MHARAGPRARVRARARGPNRARPGVLRRAPRGGVAGRESESESARSGTHPEGTRNRPGDGGVRVLRRGRVRRSDAEGPEGRARRARGGEQGEGRAGGAAQASVHGGRRHGPGAAEELGAVAVSAPFPRPRRRREVSDGARGEQEVRERGDGRRTEGHRVARGRRGDRSSARGAETPAGRSRGDLRRFQRRLHEARHRVRRRRAHRVDVGLARRSASQRVAARGNQGGSQAVAGAGVPEHATRGSRRDVHAGSDKQGRPDHFRFEAHQVLDTAAARTQAAGRGGGRRGGSILPETAVAREGRPVGTQRESRGRPMRGVPPLGQGQGRGS